MHTMHKEIGLNRQDAKVSEEGLPQTHAALTGICRSGRSVDTLTSKLIRLSGCPPIHVRVADSAACVRVLKNLVLLVHLCGQLSGICVNLWCQCGSHLRFHSSVSFLAFLAPWRLKSLSG
jgi:hypothetical protein